MAFQKLKNLCLGLCKINKIILLISVNSERKLGVTINSDRKCDRFLSQVFENFDIPGQNDLKH